MLASGRQSSLRYAKLQLANGPTYVKVEEHLGVSWAVLAIDPPEEDPLPASPRSSFQPAPLLSFDLLAPLRPSKILSVGRNHRGHAIETGFEVPSRPLLFLKPPSTILAPGASIVLPAPSVRSDYEGELGLVIGRRCRDLSINDDLRSVIRGCTIVNDVTARDLQSSDGEWTGFDTFCPVGPLVVSPEELDPGFNAPVTVVTKLNGEERQRGSSADLVFSIPRLLVYITSVMTLERRSHFDWYTSGRRTFGRGRSG